MKKLLLSISFIVCFFAGFSQSIVQRSTGANTLVDPNLFTSRSFRPPVFLDTATANAQTPTTLDSCGKLIFTYDVMSLWVRSCSPSKHWEQVGRDISFENSTSISFSGTGGPATPIVAELIVSGQSDNAVQLLGDGIYVKNKIVNGLNSGGILTWVSGYTYDVSAAFYAIGGVEYSAPETQVTLANADPTLDRIDVVVANTNGTITVITGTPAANPQEPSVDVTTQLPLNFIYVTANTVQPVIPQDWIYENYVTNSWTTVSSTPRIVVNSTNNPYSVPLDVEGTLARNGDNIRFTTINPLTISDYNILTLKIFSKVVWVNTSKIVLQWYDAGAVATGLPVSIANNAYGFQSSQTTSYQTLSIALVGFGSLVNPTNLLMTVTTIGGATIGFYIDDIQLQNSEIPTFGNFYAQGGNLFGATAVLGTNDNFPQTFIANNTERMRIAATGQVLIGTTTTSGGSLLQVQGTTKSQTYTTNSFLTITDDAINSEVDITVANDLRSTYGTNGSDYNVFANGTFRITKSATSKSTTLAKFTQTSANMDGFHLGNQLANDTYTATIGTVNSYYLGTASYVGTGEVSPSNGIFGININFNNQSTVNNPNAAWFQQSLSGVSTFPWILKKTGQQVWGQYGINTFAGTPAYALGVDASGNVIEFAASGGISSITADNGLTANTSTNVRLGGTLLGHTTVDGGANKMIFTSANAGADSATVLIKNTGTGRGLWVISATSVGVVSNSSTGNFGAFVGTSSAGITMALNATTTGQAITANSAEAQAGTFSTTPSSTNSVTGIITISRQTSGTAANGLGGAVEYVLETSTGAIDTSTRLISRWTDATLATRTSEFSITGVNNAGNNTTIFTLFGNGALQLNKYGVNTFAGVAAYVLGVDASGNVVEVAAAGAGMTNVLTATGSMIYSSSGTTPAELLIGTTGQVLQVSAGGIPEWVTPGVGGSVTSVAQSFTGGLISVSGSPITTSGTLALTVAGTSGGIPYFSSSSTWASSAALAANAIVIGGGAGAAPATTTTGTGVITALGVNVGSSGAFIVNAGALGTPSSGTLTNATGLPIATGISGLGTGVATALAVNTGSSGAFVLFNGALGTPSSGTISTGVTIGDVTINVTGTDATGDIFYRNSGGLLTRLGIGSAGQILTVSSGIPAWSPASAAGVSSNQGTANQVLVNGTSGSPQTGAIILTLPQNIHTGSTPQFVGMLLTGNTADVAGLNVNGTITTRYGIFNAPDITIATGQNGSVYSSQGNITEGSSGTHSLIAGIEVGTPNIISGSATVANTATLYVQGAMSATVTGANYSLWVDDGTVRIDNLAGAGKYVVTDANGVLTSGFNRTVQTLTDGATITWTTANGGNAKVTLAGTGRTLVIPDPIAGETYTIEITQGSGGSKTITTWPTGTTWSGDNTLSTTAGDVDVAVLYWNGTNFRAVLTTDYN